MLHEPGHSSLRGSTFVGGRSDSRRCDARVPRDERDGPVRQCLRGVTEAHFTARRVAIFGIDANALRSLVVI